MNVKEVPPVRVRADNWKHLCLLISDALQSRGFLTDTETTLLAAVDALIADELPSTDPPPPPPCDEWDDIATGQYL